ncbi:hypothetical protein SPBR_07098 [Sporothrix brasiliensis 5110]|uniref:Major facilitator superfamily (MFS) profile domain-containing protein n=1 Tax=Sporothrix brasiliensis 5110 TaxID=1398154 RepID=A0A0C2ERU1_9PEZI|nr:uncharacterized protein SPBR_07098 [Sporothrix brasiliensis 5110]KIH89069.1 hypothetical protein SPBR_07098 [Sporothrix brasiliensis 5110]
MASTIHEETPLLADDRIDSDVDAGLARPGADTDNDENAVAGSVTAAHRRRVMIVVFAQVIMIDFAAFFLDVPQTSILERIICDRYYNTDGAKSGADNGTISVLPDCTAGPVQTELATITQMLNTFNRLPSLFVAIPLGMAADRYGRRPIIILVLVGALLQDAMAKVVLWRPDLFAPRLIWLSSLAGFVGGSDAVASSVVYLVVADVVSPQERAQVFFALTACQKIGEIAGTPLSSLLMYTFSPWTPYLLSTALTLLALAVLLLYLPETLQKTKTVQSVAASDADEEAEEATNDASSARTKSVTRAIVPKFRPLLKTNIVAVILAFFVSALGRQATSFLLQYIHQRFNWTYEKASILVTLRAAVDLALLSVGLPLFNRILVQRYTQNAYAKDLLISRLSVAFFSIGSLGIALAPVVPLVALGIIVFALGSGFPPAARSLATSFVRQDEAGLLYTALALAQTIGGLTAGPLLAFSFEWSINHLGHDWTGIPFVLVAGLFAFGFMALTFVQI